MCDSNKNQTRPEQLHGDTIGRMAERGLSSVSGAASEDLRFGTASGSNKRAPQCSPLLVKTMIALHTNPSEELPLLVTSRYPAQQEIIDILIRAGIIRRYEGVDSFQCDVNKEALRVYVEALCRVSLPVQSWRIP